MIRSPMTWRGPVLAAVMASTAAAPALAATEKAPPTPPVMQQVIDCRKVTDETQRLACYDKAVDGMAKAQESGDLVALDRAQRRAAKRQTFGLSLPSLAFLDHGEDADRLTVKIVEARQDPYGKWVITVEGGAVWRQTDGSELPKGAHPGSTAVINRGMIGGYMMDIDNQLGIKVHRQAE